MIREKNLKLVNHSDSFRSNKEILHQSIHFPWASNIDATCLIMVCISFLQSSAMIEKKVSCIQDHNSIISFGGVSH